MADLPGSAAGLRFRRIHDGTRVHSAAGRPIPERLFEIWERRDVLRMLTERRLRAKYAGSVLGYAWSLIQPALIILTYFLLLKIFNRSYPMYPLFMASALLPWQWFAQTMGGSSGTLRQNSRLITTIDLPREIYPLADVAVRTVEYLLSLPIVLVVAWFYSAQPSRFLLLWPLAFVLELMLCVGIALMLSSLNVLLRDIGQVMGIVVRMMFFLVPTLYPLAKLSPAAQRIVSYNPIVGILEMNRCIWFPSLWTGWRPVYFSVIGAFVTLIAGFLVFSRVEAAVLKEL